MLSDHCERKALAVASAAVASVTRSSPVSTRDCGEMPAALASTDHAVSQSEVRCLLASTDHAVSVRQSTRTRARERQVREARRQTGEREGGGGNGYQRDHTSSTYMSERGRGGDTERVGGGERERGKERGCVQKREIGRGRWRGRWRGRERDRELLHITHTHTQIDKTQTQTQTCMKRGDAQTKGREHIKGPVHLLHVEK